MWQVNWTDYGGDCDIYNDIDNDMFANTGDYIS